MAIYTDYGRYAKAKAFKRSLETGHTTYMFFGLGNPQWDVYNAESSSELELQPMPEPPYNSDIALDTSSQFYDQFAKLYWTSFNQSASSLYVQQYYLDSAVSKYIPKFPAIWDVSDSEILPDIKQSELSQAVVTPDLLQGVTGIPAQYLAEIALRSFGWNMTINNVSIPIKHPIGLLGAVKCDISLVIELQEPTGDIAEFWYGDRVWKIVPDNIELSSDSELPHHLFFSATINPLQLCKNLEVISSNLVPRQLAIYSMTGDGPTQFRVGEYLFNFGQYSDSELYSGVLSNASLTVPEVSSHVLQLVPKHTNGTISFGGTSSVAGHDANCKEFEFILHDYIKGNSTARSIHQIDRFGYIVGF